MGDHVESLNLWQRLQLVWGLMRDARVAPWVKRVGPAAILAYVVSPIDLIPDFLLGPGQVDDLGVLTIGLLLLARMLVRFAPDQVVSEHMSRITGVGPGSRRASRSTSGPTIDTSGRVR